MIHKPQQSKQEKPAKQPKRLLVGGTVTQVISRFHAMQDAAWALSKTVEDILQEPEKLDQVVSLARAVLSHAEALQKMERE